MRGLAPRTAASCASQSCEQLAPRRPRPRSRQPAAQRALEDAGEEGQKVHPLVGMEPVRVGRAEQQEAAEVLRPEVQPQHRLGADRVRLGPVDLGRAPRPAAAASPGARPGRGRPARRPRPRPRAAPPPGRARCPSAPAAPRARPPAPRAPGGSPRRRGSSPRHGRAPAGSRRSRPGRAPPGSARCTWLVPATFS